MKEPSASNSINLLLFFTMAPNYRKYLWDIWSICWNIPIFNEYCTMNLWIPWKSYDFVTEEEAQTAGPRRETKGPSISSILSLFIKHLLLTFEHSFIPSHKFNCMCEGDAESNPCEISTFAFTLFWYTLSPRWWGKKMQGMLCVRKFGLSGHSIWEI